MSTTHAHSTEPGGADDLRALAWVQDEVRRSLEATNKALRRHLKEAESLGGSDVDAVDPSVLRAAKNHLHQAAGALEIVGMTVPAQVLRASEAAVQRLIAKPALVNGQSVDALEQASFAVLDFLGRLVMEKPVSAVALFPQYRAVQVVAGADRVHPADLWDFDWRWREVQLPPVAGARPVDAAAREAMERMMLRLMRKPDRSTLRHMSDLCAELSAGSTGRLATLWGLAAGFFDAQSAGLLRGDVFVKRAAPRLLTQTRAGANAVDVSDRLAKDLLFFCNCAQVPSSEHPAPRLTAVRAAYGLDAVPAVPDYDAAHLGRFDPAWIAQASKRVAAARDAWSAIAGGDMHRVAALNETFALVGDSLRRLYPDGDRLAQALSRAAAQTAHKGEAPSTALAMEVATSVLYLEASLEDAELDHPQLAERIDHLAQRVDDVRQGAEPQPLDSWMEELYRRVSDRQTMGSVVQELRTSLSEVEKQIDQYFRDPSQREVLYAVPGQLSSMRGVFSVLGLDQASQAVLRMRDDVDALAQAPVSPHPAAGGAFERLADSMGALSFLIDMLSVQPQLAKSFFRFDAASGRLKALMGQAPRGPAFVDSAPDAGPGLVDRAQQIAISAAREDVSDDTLAGQLDNLAQQALIAEERTLAEKMSSAKAALARTSDAEARRALRADLAQSIQGVAAPAAPPPATPAPAAPGDDSEMREVFIEEAREVVDQAREALARLERHDRDRHDDLEDMTAVRRAFHTLKGSSRMVGLNDFGEAAWACEQLYNARLAQGSAMDAPLRNLTTQALDYLGDWVDAIAAARETHHRSAAVVTAADALRQEGRLVPIGAAPEPLEEIVPDLPQAFELDLGRLEAHAMPAPAAEPAAQGAQVIPDLGDLPPPQWTPEPPDQGMAATLPLLPSLPEAEVVEPPPPSVEIIELDFEALDDALEKPAAQDVAETGSEALAEEQVKVVGPLRIDIAMFNIFLNEADELSRRLGMEVSEWATAAAGPPGEVPVVLAHSLAGSSATVGFADLSTLARSLEHALMRANEANRFAPDEPALFSEAAEEIRRLLHQFAAGFLRSPTPGLVDRLEAHEPSPIATATQVEPAELLGPSEGVDEGLPASVPAAPAGNDDRVEESIGATVEAEPPVAEAVTALEPEPTAPEDVSPTLEPLHAMAEAPLVARVDDAFDDDEDIDAHDAVDAELFAIFAEEAQDLVPQLQSRMREWIGRPADTRAAAACMRTLHTLKGGARLAGAMRLGERAHRLETAIEHLVARSDVQAADVEPLLNRVDAIENACEQLRRGGERRVAGRRVDVTASEVGKASTDVDMPVVLPPAVEQPPSSPPPAHELEPAAAAAALEDAPQTIDWGRFTGAASARPSSLEHAPSIATAAVRVRAPLLDRLVGHAGEVSIARARIETDVAQIKSSLTDLTENLERMRGQLRDIELQAESQISSRMEAARAAARDFDPLEMDRYTRTQELTRMLAESVNDVATVQRGLQRALQSAEDELAAQSRLTRSLQDDLLRTRMVEFEVLADRLYRVVRQAAKETAKHVRLDIVGGSIEIDRSVLDRMTGAFEHLLRNCVTHGIETPPVRVAAGKDETGTIQITLRHEGNEVAIEFRDDGAGLDLPRIRERALALGLIDPVRAVSDAELADCVFAPGFSTAQQVTELAGRGVGMDVVRSEVVGMGGRIQTATTVGQGTAFTLVLPLTTAVTQVVLLRCGEISVAVPSTLVEVVRRAKADEIEQAYRDGSWSLDAEPAPFYWLGALLDGEVRGPVAVRTAPVVMIRSAAQRVAVHVDEVLGNQEVVVKNLGPQLARLPGLAGMTLLPSGMVAPIYNPVALAALYGDAVRQRLQASQAAATTAGAAPAAEAIETLPPLVLVVDDSLTVRRVTQRLLTREGYRVTTAKDGLDAIERLAEETPAVILSDIEMPRMDGFDFVRNVRADERFAKLPVIMITSRIAQKHRDYAQELGVDHYLGKPYSEDELLGLVARHARHEVMATD